MTFLRALVVLAAGVLIASSASGPLVAGEEASESPLSAEVPTSEDTEPPVGDEAGAPIAEPSLYTYDPGNPGWAYGRNPEDESGWIRVDLRLFGLEGPPDDPLERPVYVLDPEQAGSAFTGDPALDSHWVSMQNLVTLLATTGEPPDLTAAPPAPTHTATPETSLRPPPAPVAPPDSGPPPKAGTYELTRDRDHLRRFAGCCDQQGLFFPLSFPESWRGRTMRVIVENARQGSPGREPTDSPSWDTRLIWSPSHPTPGTQFEGNWCPAGPRPATTCWVAGANPGGWRIDPGRYFLFFPGGIPGKLYEGSHEVISVRFRLEFTS